MNRRQRKKKKVGEFSEYGFAMRVVYRVDDPTQHTDEFWDSLFEYLEERNLGVTGVVEEMVLARLCVRANCLRCNRKIGSDRPRFRHVTSDELREFARFLVTALGAHSVWAYMGLVDVHRVAKTDTLKFTELCTQT